MRPLAALLACALLSGASPGGVYLDVPFVKQSKNACGAASLAMVIDYWEHQQARPAHADSGAIHREIYSPQAGGAYAKELEAYLKRNGFRAFPLRGTWDDLREHLEKGRPLIVALQSGRDTFHYVVVTGIDWEQNIVWKHDPAQRQLMQQHRGEFEREWRAAGNWTLLALPGEPLSSAR